MLTRVGGFCRASPGLIGKDEVVLHHVDGEPHVFLVEVSFNSYDALTLGTYLSPKAVLVSVPFSAEVRSDPRPVQEGRQMQDAFENS